MTIALAGVLWGLWANTLRLDRKWRFELYGFDFAIGAVLGAVALAYTLGNAGSGNSFTFDDNLTIAGRRALATAAAAGVLYCLGNLLTLAGLTIAGMSTALPAAAAVALAVGAAFHRGGSAGLVWGGVAVGLLAIVALGMARRAAGAGMAGLILSATGGLFVGLALQVADWSREGEIGLGAYAVAVFLSAGMLAATPLVNVYFLNLPVQGAPLSFLAYFKATRGLHLAGVAGGVLWAAGTAAFFAAMSYEGGPKFLGLQAVAMGGAVLGGLAGLTVWGEAGTNSRAKGLILLGLAALGAGLGLVYAGA